MTTSRSLRPCAVHYDNHTTRFHYVSPPLKLSLGKKERHVNADELKSGSKTGATRTGALCGVSR